MEDGSIRIEEATEEALGTYTCVPYNTLGTMGQSAPARLVLKVRPRAGSSLCVGGLPKRHLHGFAVLALGPPVFYGATRLGVQAGGWPGAAHPLRCCRGPLPCHHVEKGTSWLWSSREMWRAVDPAAAALMGGGARERVRVMRGVLCPARHGDARGAEGVVQPSLSSCQTSEVLVASLSLT